jgi:hypothetical protein
MAANCGRCRLPGKPMVPHDLAHKLFIFLKTHVGT